MHLSFAQNSGTCHQWTVSLGDNAIKVVQNIKQMLNDYIKTTEKVRPDPPPPSNGVLLVGWGAPATLS